MNWRGLKGFILALLVLSFALHAFGVWVVPTIVLIILTGAMALADFATNQYVFGASWTACAIYNLVYYFFV